MASVLRFSPDSADSSKEETTAHGETSQVLLVANGSDHPGILDEISHYVADRRGRIEAVRVSSLRGRFVLLMLLSGDAEAIKQLGVDLHILAERTGVRASLEAPDDPAGGYTASTHFRLTAAGESGSAIDESSVFRQCSNLFKVLNVNILDVETQLGFGGGFDLMMEVAVPREVPVTQLRELLGQLLHGRGVRWELSAAGD